MSEFTDSYQPIHEVTANIITMTQSEKDMVNHPAHYQSASKCVCGKNIECIQVTREMNFNLGNALKYIWRCDSKGNKSEDLKKAIWYLKDELNRYANV